MLKVGSIARSSLVLMAMLVVPAQAGATAGDPDYSFGHNGVATLTNPAPGFEFLNRVVLQPDGKIVAAGRLVSKKHGADVGVVRFLPNGSRDHSFDGPNGHGNGVVKIPVSSGTGLDGGLGLALDDQDRIMVAGFAGTANGDRNIVLRLRPNGKLDKTFEGDGGDGDGIVTLPLAAAGDDEYLDAIAIQGDGAIVVGGATDVDPTAGENLDMVLARLLPDGKLDPAFDGDGGSANGIFTLPIAPGTTDDELYEIRLSASGILIAGETGYDGGVNKSDFALARFDSSDGSLDTSFDGDGKVITQVTSGYDYATGLAEPGGGDIVATGTANDLAPGDLALVRYDSSGQLVPTFDGDEGAGNGIVTASFAPTSTERGSYLAVEPSGDLVISGETIHPGDDSALARFDPDDGTIDTGFGDQGWVVNPLSVGSDRSRGSVARPDGRIIAVGERSGDTDFDAYVARYHDDDKPPQTKITAKPAPGSGDHSPTFRFAADMPATFKCSLDGGNFKNCDSPKTYHGVANGGHVFRVKAFDSRPVADPTPAKAGFQIAG